MSAIPLPTEARWRFGPFDLDAAERRLLRDGTPLRLEPKAFDLLALLAARGGRLVRRAEIMDALWPDTAVGDASLLRQVSALRAVLGDRERSFVETVSKSGYRLRLPVAAAAEAAPGGSAGLERCARARHFWNRRTPESLERAVRLFEQAAALDPGLAAAHAGRADALALLAGYRLPPAAYADAYASARAALALDPDLPDGHTALGLLAQKEALDWERAEAAYRRALSLDPRHATALMRLGELLALRGRFDAGLEVLATARRSDPVSPAVGTDLAKACLYARRYERARRVCLDVLDLDPSFPRARLYLGLASLLSGDASGLSAVHAFARAERSAYAQGVLAWAEGVLGRKRRARALRADLERRPDFVPPYARLLARLGDGDREGALGLLAPMVEERHNVLGLGVSPLLDPLRGAAAFRSFVAAGRLVAHAA